MNTLTKMVNFRVQSGKFTPGRKIYTDGVSRVTDNYQVWCCVKLYTVVLLCYCVVHCCTPLLLHENFSGTFCTDKSVPNLVSAFYFSQNDFFLLAFKIFFYFFVWLALNIFLFLSDLLSRYFLSFRLFWLSVPIHTWLYLTVPGSAMVSTLNFDWDGYLWMIVC